MPFSWLALVLSPLPVPLIAGVLMTGGAQDGLLAFAISFVVSCFFSYGAMVGLLLPALFVVSRVVRLTAVRTGALGALLGGFAYLPVTLVMYKGSGPDSGPPTESYWEFMSRGFWTPSLIFVGAGLITALAYWFLAKLRVKAQTPADGKI